MPSDPAVGPSPTADDLATAEGLAARAARYPFDQPAGSYVFTRSGSLPLVDGAAPCGPGALVRDGDRTLSWARLCEEQDAPARSRRTAILGYGSNPAPETLARKLRDDPATGVAVPVLELELAGFDAVWSAHVHAGYVPATIAPVPSTVLRAWALLLTAEELEVVNASESLGRNYALGRLEGARATFADGSLCGDLLSYVSLHGALAQGGRPVAVAPVGAQGRRLQALDEPAVLRRVCEATAPGRDEASFLRDLATDAGAAAACTAALAATAIPFAWPGWRPLVPAG